MSPCRSPRVRLQRSSDGGSRSCIRRHELTDQEWELLAPLIPRAATGRPRVEDRQVIDSTVYKIRTGISWRDLPERYGPWKTVYTRFRRYALDGVFTRALQQIQAHADAAGDIDWLVQIDSTVVRAHQHAAATGRKKGQYRPDEPADHAPGRSRGGLTTKIHLACDGKGRPFAILVTPGQRHDSIYTRPLLERIHVPALVRAGRAAGPVKSSQTRHPVLLSVKQLPRLPHRSAKTWHRADHPGEDRPTTAPAEPRLPRRETTKVRPGDLPATQYDRSAWFVVVFLPLHRAVVASTAGGVASAQTAKGGRCVGSRAWNANVAHTALISCKIQLHFECHRLRD
ncbi:IS5 family transposase [Streptomyces mirabilis]|uniref:IS5 family transposase n=1 Tax=Streptomyces mirabilis TaxID=68239 RepID=UPI0036DEFDA3